MHHFVPLGFSDSLGLSPLSQVVPLLSLSGSISSTRSLKMKSYLDLSLGIPSLFPFLPRILAILCSNLFYIHHSQIFVDISYTQRKVENFQSLNLCCLNFFFYNHLHKSLIQCYGDKRNPKGTGFSWKSKTHCGVHLMCLPGAGNWVPICSVILDRYFHFLGSRFERPQAWLNCSVNQWLNVNSAKWHFIFKIWAPPYLSGSGIKGQQ